MTTISTAEPDTEYATFAPEKVFSAKKAPQLPHAHTFPSTPSARLPLADLIGNYDDACQRPALKDDSPEDYIGWIPNSSNVLLTPGRKRKRARSSSPLSSSQRQNESSRFDFGVQSAEKQTPSADPVMNLWQRYATGRGAEEGLQAPDFSHLMLQASPRPLETPQRKGDGLRRWASTGADWPTTKAKRRRAAKTPVTVWEEQEVDTSGRSKVAAMVEKMQKSLASQRIEHPEQTEEAKLDGPSSSSSLPETGVKDVITRFTGQQFVQTNSNAARANERPTVLERGSQMSQEEFGSDVFVEDIQATISPRTPALISSGCTRINTASRPPAQRGPTLDDFGSDLTVEDILQSRIVNDSVISAPLHLRSKAPLPAFKRPAITRPPVKIKPLIPAAQELDEFGDDMDFTAEDLEELMSQPVPVKANTPLYQNPEQTNTPLQQGTVSNGNAAVLEAAATTNIDDDDDDDEFGFNDIDDNSFEDAVISATQAFMASVSKTN